MDTLARFTSWVENAERTVTEKGDFREESFAVWDGDDVYAIKITVANTGDSYGYGLRIFSESGDIIEHKAIMDKFVAIIPHKGRTDENKYIYLLDYWKRKKMQGEWQDICPDCWDELQKRML